MEEKLHVILENYRIPQTGLNIRAFGTGLINHTWLISSGDMQEKYILQKINESVFKHPEYIAENIASIGSYLQSHFPSYFFIQPVPTKDGSYLVRVPNDGCYRLTPFAEGSHSADTVTDTNVAYEAARQFGRFTAYLNDFPAETLHITIPDFHNLSIRAVQFRDALHSAAPDTINQCLKEINELKAFASIEQRWELIKNDASIPKRVIHHETKISNCLFDDLQQGMAVIDLDTVMPGYYISDVGDMCRSYLCPLNEESTDYEDIDIRLDYFEALADGYLSEMGDVLTPNELELFVYSGQFLMYMQALRFLADFLAGNPYYPVKHPMHNLDRTKNQLALLRQYTAHEKELKRIVEKHKR